MITYALSAALAAGLVDAPSLPEHAASTTAAARSVATHPEPNRADQAETESHKSSPNWPYAVAGGKPAQVRAPSPEERALEKAAREFRIQTYNTYRLNRAEFNRRRAAWDYVHAQWKAAGSRPEDQAALLDWLASATERSRPGVAAELPEAPLFGDVAAAQRDDAQPPIVEGVAAVVSDVGHKEAATELETHKFHEPPRTFAPAWSGATDVAPLNTTTNRPGTPETNLQPADPAVDRTDSLPAAALPAAVFEATPAASVLPAAGAPSSMTEPTFAPAPAASAGSTRAPAPPVVVDWKIVEQQAANHAEVASATPVQSDLNVGDLLARAAGFRVSVRTINSILADHENLDPDQLSTIVGELETLLTQRGDLLLYEQLVPAEERARLTDALEFPEAALVDLEGRLTATRQQLKDNTEAPLHAAKAERIEELTARLEKLRKLNSEQ